MFEFLFDKTEQKKVFFVATRESKENPLLSKLPAFPKQDGSWAQNGFLRIQNGVLLSAPNLPCSSQKVTAFFLSPRNKGTDYLLHYLRFHLSVYVIRSSHGFLSSFCSFESGFMEGGGGMMYLFINDDAEKEDKVVICKSEHLLLMVTVTVVY